ncbi:MAG: dienelactone hydrolase family protein [Vulcanimicrobiaceae bacterium]
MLQEIFGVTADMRRIADLLSQHGYVALAINYYHRHDPTLDLAYDDEGIAKGRAAAATVTRDTIGPDLRAAIDWLNEQDFVRKNHIATWGFCAGGSMAFFSSMQPGVSGAVCFYGGQIAKPLHSGGTALIGDVDKVRAPLLLIFGGQDQSIPREDIDTIEKALSSAKKQFYIHTYPNEGHGFFRKSSEDFSNPDVKDAWTRVQEFLKGTLG